MKFIAGISLTCLFLIQALVPSMDICCELEKLPALMEHYRAHQSLDGDSFVEFVAEDYFNGDGTAQGHHEDDEHEDLPFQGDHQCHHAPFLCTVNGPIFLSTVRVPHIIEYRDFSTSLISEFSDSPFQPPKA
ncbi:hypothetical protein N6H18_14650 [Reichenbachiella agarivorans]|uniref:Uncharacterized protein n=1 Tax=Reichenbachiella agarivorans TaxID=2979464 RepID=A0ABY6CPA1_9BACT|nr:hypothetical protein [Reichenbachiella agarivorans]UXP31589.1 hypothetical protein N6H18_14650 [Reichenbachiella agarivorans]